MADIDVINAYMATLTEDDLPDPDPPGPPVQSITTAVVNRVVQELMDPAGVHNPRRMVRLAWTEYNRKHSREQFRMIISAYMARVAELTEEV